MKLRLLPSFADMYDPACSENKTILNACNAVEDFLYDCTIDQYARAATAIDAQQFTTNFTINKITRIFTKIIAAMGIVVGSVVTLGIGPSIKVYVDRKSAKIARARLAQQQIDLRAAEKKRAKTKHQVFILGAITAGLASFGLWKMMHMTHNGEIVLEPPFSEPPLPPLPLIDNVLALVPSTEPQTDLLEPPKEISLKEISLVTSRGKELAIYRKFSFGKEVEKDSIFSPIFSSNPRIKTHIVAVLEKGKELAIYSKWSLEDILRKANIIPALKNITMKSNISAVIQKGKELGKQVVMGKGFILKEAATKANKLVALIFPFHFGNLNETYSSPSLPLRNITYFPWETSFLSAVKVNFPTLAPDRFGLGRGTIFTRPIKEPTQSRFNTDSYVSRISDTAAF